MLEALPTTGRLELVRGTPRRRVWHRRLSSNLYTFAPELARGGVELARTPSTGGSVTLPAPPGAPIGWADADDTNLAANAGVVDGSSLTAVKQKGTLSSGGNDFVQQGVLSTCPTFAKIATAGKINNLSGIVFNSASLQWLATAVFAAQPAAMTAAFIVRHDSVAVSQFVADGGAGGRAGLQTNSATGLLNITGAGVFATNKNVFAGTWDLIVVNYAGAASSLRLDGSTSTAGNPTSSGVTQFTLGSFIGGGGYFTGKFNQAAWWVDGTANTLIEAWAASRVGALPQ